MRRQFCERVDRLDLFARDVCEWIEFQPDAVILDDRNRGTQAALKAFAPVDPGPERRQCPLERLHLPDPAAGIAIGDPQFAIPILARQRLLDWFDLTDVEQAQDR